MREKLATLVTVSLAVLSAGSCGEQAAAPPKPPAVVAVKPAVRREVRSGVTLTGTVEPEQRARLVAQVDGEVESLAAREGDAVRRGDVLVRIDPSRLQAALDEARAEQQAVLVDLEEAQRVLERDRVLFERQGIGRERLEQSQTTVRRLEAATARAAARIAGLAAQLADTEVRAPFDGYVLERYVELGDVVKSGAALLSVASRKAYALIQVADTDLARVKVGDAARVSLGSNAKEGVEARIARIRPQVDPATRTAAVEVEPVASVSGFLPGMLVRVTLTLDRRSGVVAVPGEALLVRPDGSAAVFLVERDTAVQRRVVTGIEGEGWIEIREGVSEGDLVVVQGQERLKDGAAVKVKGAGTRQAHGPMDSGGRGDSPAPPTAGTGGQK